MKWEAKEASTVNSAITFYFLISAFIAALHLSSISSTFSFLISPRSSVPEGIRELISPPRRYKTPTDDSSSPVTSLSALPLHSFSSLWHLFLSLTTAVPSLANFHQEEMRGLRTLEGGRLCTTCFTCEASGGLQSIIMISSPVGEERGGEDVRARTWYGLS